jgi:hypothetical protein
MADTSTAEGRSKRIVELAEGYFQSRSRRGLTRLIGLSDSDFDISSADHGEAPQGARW